MEVFHVETDGEWFYVQLDSGRVTLRTQSEERLPLLPGWEPKVVLRGAEICVLALCHVDQSTAVWFLDQSFHFVTNDIEHLNEIALHELHAALEQSAGAIWRELVCSGRPALTDAPRQAFRYLAGLGNPVADTIASRIIPEIRTACMNEADGLAVIEAAGSAISAPVLRGMFERDFLEDMIATIAEGRLTLPSPVDGMPMATDIGFSINAGTIAYKFHDQRNDVVVFAFAALWRITLAAIYVPANGLLIYAHRSNERHLSDYLGGIPPHIALFRHAVDHALPLDEYLKFPARRVVIQYNQDHLGHHLYNELGGLDRVARTIPRDKLPEILVVNSHSSEMYGPLDRLYPKFEGKVDRVMRDAFALTRHTYASRYCLVRPTDDYVSRDLAYRIIRYLEEQPDVVSHSHHHAALTARGFSVAMLGLRTENRTLVDPVNFFVEAIDALAERLGHVAIVVDGHDAVASDPVERVYPSFLERGATRSPLEVEQEIVAAIRLHYAGRDDVEIISTVAATMSVTLFWCMRSLLVITPWGAGLAKYRWVCNRPTLIVGGEHFFRHAGPMTVHLYDARHFMEAPTRVVFFSADDVEDDPSAPLLVGVADANRVNYRVKRGRVRPRVMEALASLGQGSGSSEQPAS